MLKYLARYTHRVAVSNSRLISLNDGQVTLRYKDYAQGSKTRLLTMDATEFIRRFLLHVFPKGFVHIRHYGFLSNRVRAEKLALCRRLLGEETMEDHASRRINTQADGRMGEPDTVHLCPVCKLGVLRVVERIRPDPMHVKRRPLFYSFDTL